MQAGGQAFGPSIDQSLDVGYSWGREGNLRRESALFGQEQSLKNSNVNHHQQPVFPESGGMSVSGLKRKI